MPEPKTFLREQTYAPVPNLRELITDVAPDLASFSHDAGVVYTTFRRMMRVKSTRRGTAMKLAKHYATLTKTTPAAAFKKLFVTNERRIGTMPPINPIFDDEVNSASTPTT